MYVPITFNYISKQIGEDEPRKRLWRSGVGA